MSGPDGGYPDHSYGQQPYGPGPQSGPPGLNQPGFNQPGLNQSGFIQPGFNEPTAKSPRAGADPAKLLGLAVAGLGGLNFIWGFLPELNAPRIDADLSVFAVGPSYVPILLLIAGLLAMAAFLPGSERSRLAVAAVSVGGAAGAIVSLGAVGPVELLATGQVSKGLGAVLLVVFGIVQAIVAIAGYVIGADFSQRVTENSQLEYTQPSVGAAPVGAVQPGWFDPSAGAMQPGPASSPGPQSGYGTQQGPAVQPGYSAYPGYGAPFGTPPGSVRPSPPPWSSAAPAPMTGPTPTGMPDPGEAVTGPQLVVNPDQRRDGDTDSRPGGVPGRQQ